MTYLPELIGILALFLLCWIALGHLLGLHKTEPVADQPRMMVGAPPDWTPEEEEAWNAMAAEYINARPDVALKHEDVKRDLRNRSPLGGWDE